MFSRIIAAILAFFIWLFPSLQKPQPLNAETVANNLMWAVETKDINLFEKQLCLNIKQNVEDLPSKITGLFDAIDGDLVGFTWRTMGGYFERDGSGKSISQNILIIDFTTSAGSYRIMGTLEYHNSFKPEEMGIRAITLFDPPTATTGVVDIRATEGVGDWHN